jgi:hypothetical protein
MPPKGFRKKQPLSSDDIRVSLHHMEAVLQSSEGLAKRHTDLPRVSVLLTVARDASRELHMAWQDALKREQVTREQDAPVDGDQS